LQHQATPPTAQYIKGSSKKVLGLAAGPAIELAQAGAFA